MASISIVLLNQQSLLHTEHYQGKADEEVDESKKLSSGNCVQITSEEIANKYKNDSSNCNENPVTIDHSTKPTVNLEATANVTKASENNSTQTGQLSVRQNKFQENESRTLFVGGLAWDTTEHDLKDYFGRFGIVTEVNIKHDALTGNPRGFGFITFDNEESLNYVIDNGPHMVRGKNVVPKKAESRLLSKKIFVGGIDKSLTEHEIKAYFTQFGKVESIKLPFDKTKNRRREFCFIIFENEEAAEAAVKQARQIIGGKECDVKRSQPQILAQLEKRKQEENACKDESCVCKEVIPNKRACIHNHGVVYATNTTFALPQAMSNFYQIYYRYPGYGDQWTYYTGFGDPTQVATLNHQVVSSTSDTPLTRQDSSD